MSENFWYLFENNGEFGDHCYGNPDLTTKDTGWAARSHMILLIGGV